MLKREGGVFSRSLHSKREEMGGGGGETVGFVGRGARVESDWHSVPLATSPLTLACFSLNVRKQLTAGSDAG